MTSGRRRLLVLAALAVLAVAWIGYCGLTVVRARTDVRAGIRAVDAARAHAGLEDIARGRPVPDLRRAAARFDRGHDRVNGLLVRPAWLLPVAGRQLRSVRALSGAAAEAAAVGAEAVDEVQDAVEPPPASGPERVALARRLARLTARVDRRLAGLDLGPRVDLVGPLARARNDLATDLAEVQAGVRRGRAAATALASLLTGPRRYLVFAANNAEMRAGTGMFLLVGELVVADGSFELRDMRPVEEVSVPPGVPPEGDLAALWGWAGAQDDFRDVMLSPRFDQGAAQAARMFAAAAGTQVDGVMAVDPLALKAILQATGPIGVDGRRVHPGNVVRELLHDQYVRFGESRSARQDVLGVMATAAFDALDRRPWSVATLVRGMARSVRGRHLMMWSTRADEQANWAASGADGTMGPTSLLVALINAGGNKLDPFMRMEADLRLLAAGESTEVEVRVALRNRTPAGASRYIAGPFPGNSLAAGAYRGIVAVTLPGQAADGRFEGVDQLAVAGPDGPTQVLGVEVVMERGESRSLVVRFRLPGRRGQLRLEPSARVPSVRWRAGGTTWDDSGPRTVRW